MNRLRDDAGDDPASERGLELLRATQPTQPMPDMKRRVWNALQQTRMRSSGAAPGIFGMPGLKAFAMGVTIVSLAGTAGAMMAGRLIVPVLDRAARSDSASGSGARAAGARSVRRAVRGRSTAAPDLAAPSSALAPSAASAQPAAQEPTSARRRRLAMSSGGRVASPIIAPAAPARSEVLEALVALRRDHDPARAAALLDGYLASHRRGAALREEALTLAIEAADARGDSAAAERFARAYQAEYPQGRFRQFAVGHTQAGLSGTSTDP